MRTTSKIQGNKITSYFKASSGKPFKMKSSSDMNVKNKENNNLTNIKQVINVKEKCKNESDSDSDCYIIDEEPQTLVSLDVEGHSEALKPSTVSVPQTEDKIIEEKEPVVEDDVIPDDNADELLIEASQHENDLDDKPDEGANITLSQQTSITQNPQYSSNYATEFFVQMVSMFLSQSCLHYLLSDDEINLTKAFMDLDPFEMKILFVRLYWLQWKWHKVEITQKYLPYNCRSEFVKNLLKNLEAKGFILSGPQMDFDEFLEIASVSELNKLMNKFPKNLFSKTSGKPKNKKAMIKSIKNVCKANNISKSFIKKGEVLTVQESMLKKMSPLLGNYIKIHESAKRTFNLLHSLMYLGVNPQLLRDKTLNWMLLNVKNGMQFYPAMELECDLPSCIFPSRKHFLEYERAYSLAETVLNLTTVKNNSVDSTVRGQQVLETCRECHNSFKLVSQQEEFVEWKLLPWLYRFTPGHQYVRALELSIKALKAFNTEDMDLEALEVLQTLLDQTTYRQHKRAYWYSEQTSILQMRQRDFTRAAEILILALNEPSMNEDEKAPLRDRAEKLATQKLVKMDAHVIKLLKGLSKFDHVQIPSIDIAAKGDEGNVRRGRKAVYYFDDRESGDRTFVTVEDYALLYYQNNSDFDCGKHWEGRIITSIFNLLFWDIIYSTVKDKRLFLSPYQEVPLDLYTPYFYENRKEMIDERLAFIETSSMADVLDKMKSVLDTRKPGDFSLHSDHIVWEQLFTVSVCLGNAGLHSICKRLALTYQYAQSGFPDLTIWNSDTNQIKFVEVKGEGDKLSFKQIQWIHYLMESNVSAEVCYVHRNDKKFRKKMSDKSKASIAVARDTDDNQNIEKIKVETKQESTNNFEISKDPIANDTVEISKDSIAVERDTEDVKIRKQVKAVFGPKRSNDSNVKFSQDNAMKISKDSITTVKVEICTDSTAVTRDPEDNQNRKKIKAGPKQYYNRRVEISKESIVTDGVEICMDSTVVTSDRDKISKDSIAVTRDTEDMKIRKQDTAFFSSNPSNDSNVKISQDNAMKISKDSIATDRVEICMDSTAVTRDPEDNQNRKKIKAGPKRYYNRRVEIFKDSIVTDGVEISKDKMEISKEPVGIDRVEIFKDSIATEKVNINNEPNCKSVKILSATSINHINVVMTTSIASPPVQTTSNLTMNALDFPVIDLTGPESPTKEENKFISSPAKVAMLARRRLEGLGSPSTSSGPLQEEGVYLRSPSKISKGVGYYISPPTTPKTFISPSKTTSARKKLNLSLTRRRLKDIDK